MTDTRWKPQYHERYFTINMNAVNSAPNKKNLKMDDIIENFMWLDIDDDEKLYAEGNVYKDIDQCVDAAKRLGCL